MVSRTSCVLCVLLALAAPRLCASEAEEKAAEVFESLFGADVARVAKTRGAEDDIDLAMRLLDTARGDAADKPALVTVLCEKAFDLASDHADGYATAVSAAEFLASQVPGKAVECAERLVTVRQKQYALAAPDAKAAAAEVLVDALLGSADAQSAAGDPAGAVSACRRAEGIARAVKSDRLAAVAARREGFAHRLTVHREIANMKALLARDSENVAARERLVRLLLVDLDDPAAAAEHLEGVQDESLTKYVPAAAKGVEAAPELACNQLGDWYRRLGGAAGKGAKAAMFARAKAYYDRFLSLHETDDLDRTAATVALKKVEAELEKLGGAPEPTPTSVARNIIKPGKWVDVLALVDPLKDTVKGRWERQGSAIAVHPSPGPNRLALPVAVGGAYELEVRFVRTTGRDDVVIVCPVGTSAVGFVLSTWHGEAGGLSYVDGKHVRNNATTVKPCPIRNGREYCVHVRVDPAGDQAAIAVTLNNLPFLTWRGAVSALSAGGMRPGLGLGAYASTVLFRSVRLKMLSGEARLLRPPGGTGVKATGSATAPAVPLPKAESGGWVPLVAGSDLGLWCDATGAKPGAGWVARDGVLMRTAKAGDIWTRHRFDDFVLDLEFMTKGNSGIFIRTADPKDPVRGGLEIQIIGPGGAPSKTSCGAVYGCQAPTADVVRAGQWNRMAIAAVKNRIAVDLNGTRIIDMDLARWTKPGRNPDGSPNKLKRALKDVTGPGHIGFQDHGDNVLFRNIRIRPLGK